MIKCSAKNIFVIILPAFAFLVFSIITILAFLILYPTLADEDKVFSQAEENFSPWFKEKWFLDEEELLLVVDRQQALPPNYYPKDLVYLAQEGVAVSNKQLQGRKIAAQALKELFKEGLKAGHSFYVFSAYRSFETQKELYKYWVEVLGLEEASRSSALPGYSEHHLGTAFDISAYDFKGDIWKNFGSSKAGRWLAENAFRFGFVMSYPEGQEEISGYIYEPWHFRYVGKEVAALIKEHKVVPCVFLRQLNELKQKYLKKS